jgi:hypothetical protein
MWALINTEIKLLVMGNFSVAKRILAPFEGHCSLEVVYIVLYTYVSHSFNVNPV